MNTPTQKQSKAELKQSKVELLLAAENVRQALNDYEFADLAQTLGNGMTETQIKNILLTAAMARTTVDYTPGVLEFNPAEQQKLQQKASSHTQRTENGSETGSGSVTHKNDRDSRILIDTALIPAVAEAQKQQNSSPATIITRTSSTLTNPTDCLLIAQDYHPSPLTTQAGTPICTSIDYVVVLAPRDSYPLMKKGHMPLARRQGAPLLAIVEAKSPDDWDAARGRLAGQCIAMLKHTGRTLFPAVLTSGILWTFNVAVAAADGKITLYESDLCDWSTDDTSDGFIFATLIELLASPCVLPPVFELES